MKLKLARPAGLGFRSRSNTYTVIIGVVAAMLAAGLSIPFIFGTPLDRVTTGPTAAGGTTAGNASNVAGNATTATESGGAAGQTGGLAGGGTAGGAGTLAGGSPAGTGLTATDRGVTADTVSVAFLLTDLAGVSAVGFGIPGFDVESQKAYINTFVDNINNQGGVYGRKIRPVFVNYDPTNQQTSLAACRAATQDNEVFAAIDPGGGLNNPGQLCFTQQNRTPLLTLGSFGTAAEQYQQSGGYLFTINQSGVRSLANLGQTLHSQGLLKGKTIGIIDRDFPGVIDTVNAGLVSVLEQNGYKVAHREDLSMDDGTATSQVPLAVQQMQAARVDALFLLTDFIIGTGFVQSADRATYRPLYFASDFESMSNDPAVQAMPSTFKAIGVTAARTGEWRVGMPEPAVDAQCREIYKSATGNDPQRSDNTYGAVDLACGTVDLLVRGLTAAGPELIRDGYVAALGQIGSIAYPNFGGLSFRPGKFDGADPIRTLAFDASCSCWMPQGDFIDPFY